MISDETKEKLLSELEKTGNIYVSCSKVGINRSTYHRWKKEDQRFRKRAERAERDGRANLCDIAEHALLIKVKEKDMTAIKYALGHNSPRYKPKRADRFTIVHETGGKAAKVPPFTIEDVIDKLEKGWEEDDKRREQEEREKDELKPKGILTELKKDGNDG